MSDGIRLDLQPLHHAGREQVRVHEARTGGNLGALASPTCQPTVNHNVAGKAADKRAQGRGDDSGQNDCERNQRELSTEQVGYPRLPICTASDTLDLLAGRLVSAAKLVSGRSATDTSDACGAS